MDFKEQLPVWKAEGVAPPETKQNEGWQIGDKPPADWFNYMWSRTYYSLDEIREKVKQEVDSLKQSGVESNKILVDNLNSKGVIASTSDTIRINVEKVNDIKLGSGNVKKNEVLAGKTYSSDEGAELVGTMPNNGVLSKTITTQNGKQIITPGYYEGGEVKAQFSNLITSNIKKGINIGGVIGDYEQLMLNNIAGWENKVTTRVIDKTVNSNRINIGELKNGEKKEFHFIGSVEVLSGSTTVKIGLSVGDASNYTSDDNRKDNIIRAFTITLEKRSDGYVSGYIGCNIINSVDAVRVREVRLGTSSAENNNVAFYVSGASKLKMKGTVIESKLSI